MIKARAWPVRAMYILIAAALAISLVIISAPAQKVSASPDLSEWSRVETPTTEDWVLAPNSTIIDWAVADGGEVAFATVLSGYDMDGDLADEGYCLVKSDDHAATWDDITNALEEVDDGNTISQLGLVATDGEDADFVAVALLEGGEIRVYVSTDGGATFEDGGQVIDTVFFAALGNVFDLAVSPEVAGARDIAIGGVDNGGAAALFRCTVVGDTPGAWVDTTVSPYTAWDDTGYPTAFTSEAVVDIEFAPSWAADKTVLAVTVDGVPASVDVYLQSGTWGTSRGWNQDSIVSIPAVDIVTNEQVNAIDRFTAGVTLPLDYAGRNSDKRYAWVWVNYFDTVDADWMGEIFRVKNTAVMSINQQIEDEPALTNVDYLGYISEGKAVAGVLGDGDYGTTVCCEGVQVYRNDQITQMDICCLPWDSACKPPTGIYAMEAFFVSEDKAYAVALEDNEDGDEGAWSVSFDDGDTWNQLSLVDTYIDYLSDVAVSPDCNKTMLVSINDNESAWCECDSVWLHADDLPEAEEYSDQWLRTWCGLLTNDWGLLRLNPEEDTGDTVYLVDYMEDTVYWNELETLACWDSGTASVSNIVDLAVKDKETIYALDDSGTVAMSDDYALGWQEAVDSEVADGYTIALWGDDILVGSDDGEVSHSDDGGETFTALKDVASGTNYVTVAFDSYFDQNGTIYAALDDGNYDGGIYLWILDESTDWYELNARPLESQVGVSDGDIYDETVDVAYTGIVLDNAAGNPMTGPDTGGVLYASYVGLLGTDYFTGVARCLTPIVEICCDIGAAEWDYLEVGLYYGDELFWATPDPLKICGCLTADTPTHLFAIDYWYYYTMDDGEEGTVWTFEDCYSKKAVDLVSPVDGFVVPADPCECFNIPFTIKWDRLCDACSYDIQFARDEDFSDIMDTWHIEKEDLPTPTEPSLWVGGLFTCEFTYFWRVRARDAETGEYIRSWWSEAREFTVAPSIAAAAITLVSPEPGATTIAIEDVGFSWSLLATADAFDWVLSENANLSSPVESKMGLAETAYECTQTLEYNTTYYWQVTAYNEGAAISMSAVGTFRTMTEEEAPGPPPVAETPVWVWIVIAIGAVLVIVVIVLIFRTRRV